MPSSAASPTWPRTWLIVFLLSDRSGVVTGSVLDWDQTVFGAHD